MGFGGGGGGGGTQVIQPPNPQIPNEALLQSAGMWRTHASSPYYSSPWRTMDFLNAAPYQGMPTMQLPQFTSGGGFTATNPPGFTGGYQPLPGVGGTPAGVFGKGNPPVMQGQAQPPKSPPGQVQAEGSSEKKT